MNTINSLKCILYYFHKHKSKSFQIQQPETGNNHVAPVAMATVMLRADSGYRHFSVLVMCCWYFIILSIFFKGLYQELFFTFLPYFLQWYSSRPEMGRFDSWTRRAHACKYKWSHFLENNKKEKWFQNIRIRDRIRLAQTEGWWRIARLERRMISASFCFLQAHRRINTRTHIQSLHIHSTLILK